jgi:hypothetical protein
MLRDTIKKILKEATSENGLGGSYVPPFKKGFRKWDKTSLDPFNEKITKDSNPIDEYNSLSNERIDENTSEWVEITDDLLNEDLAVWFGTKKKPKGSKQPKGPWVNICRKKEGGGHPPCGRDEATNKGYPKCRAAGVASKMTDSQKKAACAQKRRAEKTNPKSGTGNKPKMVSYKPKKKQNESIEDLVKSVLRDFI